MNGSLLRNCSLLVGLLLASLFATAQSGIKFKLQLMPDGQYWGVYAKPTDDLFPSSNTLTGTGQVTIVMPLNYAWSSFTSVSGQWGGSSPSIVNGPSEAPTKSYVTIGFISDNPTIQYQSGHESLLFKFKKDSTCPDQLYLLDSNDPFMPPNSISSNPGNELTIFDFGNGLELYSYVGNYAPFAWDCHDTDGDGLLNAHEDTNGNGVFDNGVDASNLYENESAYSGDMLYKLKLMPDGQSWGVYVKPAEGVSPSTNNTITGSGQVTVVMPKNYAWNTLTSVNGQWTPHTPIDGPVENPTRRYMSFGFSNEINPIPFQAGMETLLFTFKGDGTCPDDIHLIDNQYDLFNHLPNSMGNNPGNEITVFDIMTLDVYEYGGNYALHSADCHDNDGDGFLNALEDTNGNGVFDPEDVSDLGEYPCGLSFNSHPSNISQCFSEAVLFMAEVVDTTPGPIPSPINYQWQESNDGGITWINLENDTLHNGVNSPALAIEYYTSYFDGYQYRLKSWTNNCDPIYSNTAQLEIDGPMTVTDEPDNVTQCAGEGATFSATVALANGNPATLTYQWEESAWIPANPLVPAGAGAYAPFTDLTNSGVYSGVTTTTLTISDVAGKYKNRYRMRHRTPICDANWTNYAQLTVEGPISFTNHPDHKTLCSGSSTNFSVQAHNEGQGNITYQWQVCMSGDSLAGPWINLPSSSIYNGANTANLSIANVADKNGYYYRCLIQTSECNSVTSYAGVLKVEGPVTFTDQPDDLIACSGTSATFIAKAELPANDNSWMDYRWQISSDGVNYSEISAAGINGFSGWQTDTLHINNVAGLNDRRFRLTANTSTCNDVSSQVALLTVEGPLTITSHPQDFTNCADEEAYFFTGLNNPGVGGVNAVNKQWQMSADNGATWQDIRQLVDTINNEIIYFGGYDADSFLIAPIIGLNGYMVRSKAWTNACDTIISNAAKLTVEGPLTFTDQPDDVIACFGDPIQFSVEVENETGQGDIQYQWQRWTVGGWVNMSNSAPYSGINTNMLTINPNYVNIYNTKYRCLVKTGNCEWADSDLANLLLEGPINFAQQPESTTACSNSPYFLNSNVINAGFGQMTYRWQYKAPNDEWKQFPTNIGSLSSIGVLNQIDPSAGWQGSFGQDLNLTNLDGLDGYQFRLVVMMAQCSDTSNIATINVLDACSGTCDLDGDGTNNDLDPDDDNDLLSDFWEAWMTSANIQDGWNYLDSQGDPIHYDPCSVDSNGDGIFDNQEDPDGDNIQNGEETDGDAAFDGNPLDPENPISSTGISFTAQPAVVQTICSNKPISFGATVVNNGTSSLTFRWERSVDGGATWQPFSTSIGNNAPYNDGMFQGAFTDELNFTSVVGMDGHKFRLVVTTTDDLATTTVSTLQVLDACQDEACDFDNDGILNEQDGDFNECGSACLKVKLQLLPDSSGWAVMAKPFGGFVPSAQNMTQYGRISVIAPSGFDFEGFQSVSGNWLPTNIDNIPGQPGRKCISFELQAQQGVHIPYQIGGETTLFTFDKTGDCPIFLYLMEQPLQGVEPNMLSGNDNGFAGGFDLCGVYARKAWRCKNPGTGPGGPIIVVTEDHFETDEPGKVTDRENSVEKLEENWFTTAPNPAGDYVNITVSESLAEGQPKLYLFDLQGKKRMEATVNETVTRLELGVFPAGVYFVSLSQNGKSLQRTKLIKH